MTLYDLENQKTTENLIDTFGKAIELFRKGDVIRTPAGGVKRVDDPIALLPRQRYFASTGNNPTVVVSGNGQRISVNFVLIGKLGDDIQENDEFSVGNSNYRVVAIDPVTDSYQRKGWVIRV